MIWFFVILLVAIALFLSAFFSGTETGLYCANRARLHLKVRQGDRRAVRLAELCSDEAGTLTVTLIGVNVADYLTTGATAFLFDEVLQLSSARVELYTVVIVAPTLFVFCNVLPKNLYQMDADRFMLASSELLAIFSRVFRLTGVVWCLRRLAGFVNRWVADPVPDMLLVEPKRKIAALLRDSLAHHDMGSVQSGLIEQVLQLSEVSVQSVMVSASRVTSLSSSASREDLVRVARTTPYTRVLVFGSHRRQMLGVINVDDALADGDWRVVGTRVEPVLTMGPYETVASALKSLQATGHDMAVVVDRGGQMTGIITLRILLDVILGALAAER